jgi:hypothetical protein
VRRATGCALLATETPLAGAFHCFLNVVIQSLWHLRCACRAAAAAPGATHGYSLRSTFRARFAALEYAHHCKVSPCVFCSLRGVFAQYEVSGGGGGGGGGALPRPCRRRTLTRHARSCGWRVVCGRQCDLARGVAPGVEQPLRAFGPREPARTRRGAGRGTSGGSRSSRLLLACCYAAAVGTASLILGGPHSPSRARLGSPPRTSLARPLTRAPPQTRCIASRLARCRTRRKRSRQCSIGSTSTKVAAPQRAAPCLASPRTHQVRAAVLADSPCQPQCISHVVFGIQLCDIRVCKVLRLASRRGARPSHPRLAKPTDLRRQQRSAA